MYLKYNMIIFKPIWHDWKAYFILQSDKELPFRPTITLYLKTINENAHNK